MAISSAVDASAQARVVGIKTEFKDLRGGQVALLPQNLAVFAEGASAVTYSTDKQQVTSAAQAGQLYGFGSPIHLSVRQLLPANGDGVGSIPVTVYPLEDNGGGSAAAGDVTPSGAVTKAGTFRLLIGGILSEQFTVSVGDSIATIVTAMTTAVNSVIDMPVIAVDGATQLDITAKWEGATGNGVVTTLLGPTDTGVTFGITQLTGATTNPSITTALAQIGQDEWVTMVLNCVDIASTTILDEFQTFFEGRWSPTIRRPAVVFVGNTTVDPTAASATAGSRKDDRVNAQLVAPGSDDIPFVVAARQLARIAPVANNNPPTDYAGQLASGLVPGTDGEQWTFADRDLAIKRGSSSIEVKDGVVSLSDTVTFYHPDGETPAAFQYVVDIVKLMQVIYNLDIIFEAPEWAGAPLIPDDQPTVNPNARKPSSAAAAIAAMVDSLGLNAIISDPETAKASIQAEIDPGNPKRLNAAVTVQLSGNTNIISVDLNFGFFFGTPAIVG